tara:strand:- start:2882 stop:4360 length:1479 start_codon:yes stop_codon:yes gene_type:complete
MKIQPNQKRFLELAENFSRIAVWGEVSFKKLSLASLHKEFFNGQKNSFLFESGQGLAKTARYSFSGRSNSKWICFEDAFLQFNNNGHIIEEPAKPNYCFELMEFEQSASPEGPPHFWGGWVGYISYDMVRCLEKFKTRNKTRSEFPDLYFFQVERLFVYDHENQILKYIIAEKIHGKAITHYQNCIENIRAVENKIKNLKSKSLLISLEDCTPLNKSRVNRNFRCNIDRNHYIKMVQTAKNYIESGDIYQANLSQRFEIDYEKDPFDLYTRLRRINPAPFSAFLQFNDFAIVSSSPERLIKLDNHSLETRPIAGTRPRGRTPGEDENMSTDLLLNEKEKAEHLMLVDLERNDLGRISCFGTVSVTDMMFLEHYSHVIHIVSNVGGRARNNTTLEEIIRAVFPGGTITGCPKIRCMEIIEELEPSPRGPYSGSLGYIGFNRLMDLSIIIRTVIVHNGKASFHAGAGIVADSDPEKEYMETLSKAEAMKKALLI